MSEILEVETKVKQKWKVFEKLKSIKHIEIIIAVIFALVMILIYISTIDGSKAKTNTTMTSGTVEAYVARTEDKVEDVLKNIKGASNVSAIITLDLSGYEVDEKTQTIKMTSFPPIKGVVVVARGVDNVAVKLNMIKAIQALFGLPSASVEIFLAK